MSSTVTDDELLQQLCVEEKEGTTTDMTRFADLFPPNLTCEEQWVSFVLSQRGIDHIRDFFLTSYESCHVQWYLNKPLAKNDTGMTVLHIEVRDQRNAVLSLLLKLGGSPNVTDLELKTPVHYAIIHNHPVCLATLLEWGGDLYQRDKSGKSPLDYCSSAFPSTIMDTLKNYLAGSELIMDEEKQQTKIIRLHLMVLDQEKSLDQFKELYYSCSVQEKLLCLESVISNQTLLFRACKAGRTDGVSFILSQTVEVPPANPATNETPLHAACEGNHYEIVVELISKFPELLLVKDKIPYRGWYPLHTACAYGASDKIVAVILVGIVRLCNNSPDLLDNLSFLDSFGLSPLFIAAVCGNTLYTSLLLHPALIDTLLSCVPSLLYGTGALVPNKCSIAHAAVLGNNTRIVKDILDSIPKTKMSLYVPCKFLSVVVLNMLGFYLNSYSPMSMTLCEENSSGKLELVSSDAITATHTPFDQMVLSPLDVVAVLGKTEVVETLLEAGMRDTNGLALRLAMFMKHSDIVINLLLHEETDTTVLTVNDRSLMNFSVSPYMSKLLLQCTEINLQNNYLTEIPLDLFQIPILKHLNLSHNNLTTLPVQEGELSITCKALQWKWSCKCLKSLNVSSNAILSLPEAIWALPNLETFDASHNRIKEIGPARYHSDNITTVDISYNNLTKVAPFLFLYEDVNLSYNELTSLPTELWYSKSIRALNVSGNRIADIDFSYHAESVTVSFTTACTNVTQKMPVIDQIGTISSLSRLDLSHNKLRAFPKHLACFATHLQQLDVSSNQISAIDISIIPPYVKTLVAKNCHIAQFGSAMNSEEKEIYQVLCISLGIGNKCPHRVHTSLQHLSNLNLSSNKLTNMQFVSVNNGTSLYPELNVLNLSANQLHGDFSPSVKLQRNLFSLDLSDNPHLESIPMELSDLHGTLFYLKLTNLPNLRDPPKQYHNLPVNNLLCYMKMRMERSVKNRSMRIMVFGDRKTGKSTLIERVKRRKLRVGRPPQVNYHGINIKHWSYAPSSSDTTVKFAIWEFNNQDVHQATHHCFYSKQALYLVVFNLMDGENGVRGLDKWLINIKVNAPTCPVIVVGTHFDRVDPKKASSLKQLVDTLYGNIAVYPNIAAIACVSSTTVRFKRNSVVNILRKQIYFVATHLFLDRGKVIYRPLKSPEDCSAFLNQQIPQAYIDLKEAVQTKAAKMLHAKEIPIMTQTEFFSYFMPTWNSDQDLNREFQYLHEQGVLLYYTDYWHTNNIFCIDIQWICSVVKNMLVSLQGCNGIVSQELFFEKCTLIPSHLQSECVELLAKYEIVLNLGESYFFIPLLLPSNLLHSPVLGDGPVNVLTFSTVEECEDDDSSSDGDIHCDDDRGYVNGDDIANDDDDDDDDDDENNYVNVMVDRAKLLNDSEYCTVAKRTKSVSSSSSISSENYVNVVVDHANDSEHCTVAKRTKSVSSSSSNSSENYVNVVVDHANDREHCTVAKRPKSISSSSISSATSSSSCNVHVKWRVPGKSTNADRQSTWPDSFNFDLHVSRSFEKAANLFSPYDYKENFSHIVDNQTDITHYPALCRIWLSPFIPKNFWFRLVSRIVSSAEIANVIVRLLPTVNSNSVNNTNFSFWSLWQQGMAIIHEDITLLEMKYEGNIQRNEAVTDHQKRQKLLLSISTPEFVAYHQESSTSHPDESLSSEDVLSLVTKLLVLIEQLILDICECFSGALTQDILGGVMSYIPCCYCLQSKSSFKQFTSSHDNNNIMISYDDHELYCFSFTEMLACYSGDTAVVCPRHGRVPVPLCAPDIAFTDMQDVVCGPNIPLSIDKEKILGKGGSGLILRGEMIKSRQLVAIKLITDSPITVTITQYLSDYKTSTASYQMIRKEVSFLSSLHHKNLTQLCGVCTNPFMLLMELAPLGSLRSIISDYETAYAAISSPVLCQSIKQIASALAFLHQRNVIYFDLKSDNVLVWQYPLPHTRADHRVWLKLTDYGISRVSGADFEIRSNGINGTPGYIAPEILLGQSEFQADKIDVFSFGMTIYELLGLQKPFDNLCKINPSIDINKYITKQKRPSLSVKGLWSPYLMQQVMSLCWEQEPTSRPQISQILNWCDLPEFQSLRTVSSMDKGSICAVCQCTVNRNHSHILASNPPSGVKFTLEHCAKFDRLFTKPEIASPKPTSSVTAHTRHELKKSKNHTQVWITQEASKNKTLLQILTYRSTQVGYRIFTTLLETEKVKVMVNVNHYMWIYTKEENLFIYHTPTMENITCIKLSNNKCSLIEMVHIPQWNVVIALWSGSRIWCIHDHVTKSGLHVVDTMKLKSKNPIIHLCTVKLPQRTELWATHGEKVAIMNHSTTTVSLETTLTCSMDKNLLFCHFIICLHFNSSKTGRSLVHVWVSFNGRPHLICWDAERRIEINSIVKPGSTNNVTSLLGHENQLYVGTLQGNVEVYDSESGTLLQQLSLHTGKVSRMLKLPAEVYQCVCAELLLIANDDFARTESSLGSSLTSQRLEHALQQDTSSRQPPSTDHIKAPLIISLGNGKADWLNVGSGEHASQPHRLTWSGYGSIDLYK